MKKLLIGAIAALLYVTPIYAQPNIIFILADDFSSNLMPIPGDNIMPNLLDLQHDGLTLTNYFVSDSRCCPSRASIFTGLLPHNTGVLTNGGVNGGYSVNKANGNEEKTFAISLQAAGYKTAFMGKYLNGYKMTRPQPPGWDEWAAYGDGYKGFDVEINHNGVVSTPEDHVTDYISQLGVAFIEDNYQDGPFFIELAPFGVHSPYTPPVRYKTSFLDRPYPLTPAFKARPNETAPNWLQDIPALSPTDEAELLDKYQKRLQSAKAIDDMLAAIRTKVLELGIEDNTYIIFSSDNGFHMGEYSLKAGKLSAFDSDIRVPFVIAGPGISPNSADNYIAMNIDLHSTFLDLANIPTNPLSNGRSLVPIFFGETIAERKMAVVEHTQDNTAEAKLYDPDFSLPSSGEPPAYIALRKKNILYIEYETGEKSYYDLAIDPYALNNIYTTLSDTRKSRLSEQIIANSTCTTAVECAMAQNNAN